MVNYWRGKKKNLLAATILVLALSVSVVAEERTTLVSYDLKVGIEPGPGAIALQAKLQVPLEDAGAQNIRFNLHETFAIRRLLVNGKDAEFSFAATERSFLMPASKSVVVSLPPGISRDRIQIDIEYEGRLKNLPELGTVPDQELAMDDQVNSRMVELASYSSWYPQFVFGTPLQVQLALSLPPGWISVCSGKKLEDRVKEGRAMTRWSSPRDIDILILASPNYRETSVRQSGVNIEVYHTQMPEDFVEAEVRQIASVVQLFADLLGETNIPAGTVKHVYSPKRKGQGKAGIAGPGLIVTSEGRTLESLAKDPSFSLFQGIAHEIAHFWWNFGAGQGDWVNESFAEYFSSIALQKISAEGEFKSALEDYRKQVRELPVDAPSLSRVPFSSDQVGYIVRYFKGTLMLNRLREILGEEKFFQACRGFFQTNKGKSIGTSEFRSFWSEKLADRKDLLDVWLDSSGGLPDLEEKKEKG